MLNIRKTYFVVYVTTVMIQFYRYRLRIILPSCFVLLSGLLAIVEAAPVNKLVSDEVLYEFSNLQKHTPKEKSRKFISDSFDGLTITRQTNKTNKSTRLMQCIVYTSPTADSIKWAIENNFILDSTFELHSEEMNVTLSWPMFFQLPNHGNLSFYTLKPSIHFQFLIT